MFKLGDADLVASLQNRTNDKSQLLWSRFRVAIKVRMCMRGTHLFIVVHPFYAIVKLYAVERCARFGAFASPGTLSFHDGCRADHIA